MKRIDWYRRHFTLPSEYEGKRVFVEFEGGGQKNMVYVNGGLVGQANGMYTHFRFDITDYISFGEFDNVIAVMVDSDYYGNEMPPGNSIDFHMTGGLHGDVSMTVTDPVYVENTCYYNEAVVNGTSSADIKGAVTIVNAGKETERVRVEAVIADRAGNERLLSSETVTVEGGKSIEAELEGSVSNPHLWSLEDPYLYTVKTNLYLDGDIKVDHYEHTLGIRTFSVTSPEETEAHAFLNGKEIKISGINKHMQAPYLVNSMPNRLHEADAYTLKYDLGVNLVRTSHYQSDPAFLEACDRIGLLVEEEALGWNDTPGWSQFEYSVLEMVKRDRNHPSVVIWSVLPNERLAGVPSDATARALVERVKTLDPSRLTIQEEDKDLTPICDIYGFHDYQLSGNVRKPGTVESWFVTEWNTNLGRYFVIPGDSEARKRNSLVEESTKLAVFQSDPRLLGSLRWDAFGYLTPNLNGEKGKNIKKWRSSGLYSAWKAPVSKTWLGYSIQAQGDPEVVGDVLKICSEWKEDSPREIWVVSNSTTVGLSYQNGTDNEINVGVLPSRSLLPTAYDGTEVGYNGLVKFTLPESCKWTEDSRLIARGYAGGDNMVKEQVVHASTYEVEKDEASVVLHNVTEEVGAGDSIYADGADMAWIVAELQDKNGQREYYGAENVSARLISGPGSLWYGKEGMSMTDGLSGFYVKSEHGIPGDTEVEVSVDIGDNYDDTWENIVYSGNWKETESQDAYHTKLHQAAEAGATATITFTGTQIALYGENRVNNGSAAITIDGVNAGNADFSCLAKYEKIGNQEVYRSSELAYGEHTLVIKAGSAKTVNLDRIKVFDGIADVVSEPFTVTSESCEIEMVECDPSLPPAEDKTNMSPQEEENLALDAGITVSGTTMGEASYLNDKVTSGTEYWGGTAVPTAANGTDTAWICFDLGERKHEISQVVSYYRNNAWPTAYKVAVSDDMDEWRLVDDISYGDAMENNKVETLTLSEPVTSRYLAIYYTQRNINASAVNTIMLYEIELMGYREPLSLKEQLEILVAQAEAVDRNAFDLSTVLVLEHALEYAHNVLGIAGFSDEDGQRAIRQLSKALDALKPKDSVVVMHTDETKTEGIENKVFYYSAREGVWAVGPIDTYANKSRQAGDFYSISFTGTKIALYTKKSAAHGYASISVDGGTPVKVDQYASVDQEDQLFYESEDLPYGKHQVKVTVTAEPSQNPTNACVGFSYAYLSGTDEMELVLEELQNAVSDREILDRGKYTLDSLEEVDKVWMEARDLLEDGNRTIDAVRDCAKRLSESLASLKEAAETQEKPDMQELTALLEEISKMADSGYTESSWREFLYDIQSVVRTYHLILTGQYPEVAIKDSDGITSVLIEAAISELTEAKAKLVEIWIWDPSVIPPLVIAGGSQYTIGGSDRTERYNRAVVALNDLGASPTQQEAEAALSTLNAAVLHADMDKIQELMTAAESMASKPDGYTPEIYQDFLTAYDSLTQVLDHQESLEIEKINGAAALKAAVDALKLDVLPEDVTVKEILIQQLPSKTRYKVGEDFDPSGLMVVVIFSDGTRLQLPEDSYTVEGFESESEGEKTLTVAYRKDSETFTAEFAVIVGDKVLEEEIEDLITDLKSALKDSELSSDEKYEVICSTLENLGAIPFTQETMTDGVWKNLQELENLIIRNSKGKIKIEVDNRSLLASMSNATVKGLGLSAPATKASSSNATMVLVVDDAEIPEDLPFPMEPAAAFDFVLNIESDDENVAEEEAQPTAPIKIIMSIPEGVKKKDLVILQIHDGRIQTIPVKVTDHMEFYIIDLSLFVIGNMAEDEKPDKEVTYWDSDSDDDWVLTGGWIWDSKGWWYEMPNGTYPSAEWKQIDGEWYYFDRYGYMATGWLLNQNRWYYLAPSGEMYRSRWLDYEGKWYYFHKDGAMLANQWIEYKANWYYLEEDGAMAESRLIEGKHQVDADGKWIPASS